MPNETYSKIFEPPQDYFGQLCVASALSADESFIENALTTFTKSDNDGRIFDRCHCLFLMLNQGHKLLDKSISGFYQLEPTSQEMWSKIAVQHAKVAVMQFGTSRMRVGYSCDENTIWRLVVCTGNWTEESAKNQIEMVWQIDVACFNYDENDAYDLLLATKFLKSLKKLYTCNKVFWNRANQMFEMIERKFSHIRKKTSRFISTLPSFENEKGLVNQGIPLWDQIVKRFKGNCNKFNRIIVGSGFYEQCGGTGKNEKPEVLKRIDGKLSCLRMTNSPKKSLVVNPDNAGQVASWLDREDWNVVKPFDFSEKNRRLHAKYIFAGKCFKDNIKSGMIYVGSGNLSIMGILSAYGKVGESAGKGNIEAGVVLPTSNILPEMECELYESLACSADSINEFNEHAAQKENADEPKWSFIPPCPLQALKRIDNSGKFEFIWCDVFDDISELVSLKMNDVTNRILCKNGEQSEWNKWGLSENDLSQLIMVDLNGTSYQIPIISEDGLLVESRKTLSNPTEWIEFLDNFPKNPEKTDGDGDGDGKGRIRSGSTRKDDDVNHDFPYQNAMRIIEGLSNLNNRYFPKDCSKADAEGFLDDWIFQVENSIKCLPSSFVSQMSAIGINFLSVLKNQDGFAPTLNPKLQSRWNDFVDRWIALWKLPKDNCIWNG